MRCARADLHVIGLQQRAALIGPVLLEFEDELLEGEHAAQAVEGVSEADG
jgi:hypothetical protein